MNLAFRTSNNQASSGQLQQSTDAQQRTSDRLAARNIALTAVLYRGTTSFTYSQDPAPNSRPPSSPKMNALARKRKIANRLRRSVAGKGGGDDGDDSPAPNSEPALGVDRDRGGRGGRQQPHDDLSDMEPCRPLRRIQATESRVITPPRGRFDAIAELHAEPGRESERADAIALAWESEMHGLRMRPPNAPHTAEMLELSLDLLLIQRRIGPIPVSTIARLRESTPAAQAASRADSLPDRTTHDDMQRFNLLFPLLWVQAGMPRTTAHLDRAIAALFAIRNGLPSDSTATSEADKEPTPATRTASSE
ncbi:hypothetical protein [Burkholderia thailandensis]|uniref:hypothetical protein n=1 Tax=Burkholderia thailandensis TaxID=57975 RepID=UPI002D782EFA|nr:hypothetical protein [Burkholderia thailandensis]WRS69994.1 hypothetical protein U9S59_29810 [Burkholderia thailandensis]